MLKFEIGTKLEVDGIACEVRSDEGVECGDCILDQLPNACNCMNCKGYIIKEIKPAKLVVAFQLVENVLLFTVVKQDEGWYEVDNGKVRAYTSPQLTDSVLYLRGYYTEKDEKVSCESCQDAVRRLNLYLENLSELGTLVNRSNDEGWQVYTFELKEK